MNIARVKLVSRGLKGIEVGYMRIEKNGGFEYNNEYVGKYKMPVNAVLRSKIGELDEYARGILSLAKGSCMEVIGIHGGSDRFQLVCWITTGVGNKGYVATTPLITETDGYDEFEDVQAIITEVYEGVEKYIDGAESITARQFVLDFSEKESKSSLTKDVAESMTDEECTAWMVETLQKRGAIVMMDEDHGLEDVAEAETEEEPGFDTEDAVPAKVITMETAKDSATHAGNKKKVASN